MLKQEIDYYDNNRQDLVNRYPEQWVVIANREVAGAGLDLRELLTSLHDQGVPLRSAYVKFVTKNPETLILAS